ncbi:arginine metabolism regulation protein II [Conoideocrella luteorostrata]|uniref:Arginine metabolism regulation protein II n=1 Tax=Conoideocrella luteorostrata TaxID=1105319 RepID=A0AAJ0FUU5_9HYPO|nr:arginine metabolism regulation protein II [Conoideocrella luteorostrata]
MIIVFRETPVCQRCWRFGIECQGYGVRLNWVLLNASNIFSDDEKDVDHGLESNRAPRRSLTNIGVSTIPRLPSPEIDSTLSSIDEWDPTQRQPSQGGFSVFAVGSAGNRQSLLEDLQPQPAPRGFSPAEGVQRTVDADADRDWTPSSNVLSGIVSSGEQTSVDTLPASETLLGLGSSVCSSVLTDTSSHPHVPRHLDMLSMPSNQKRLIHHWVTFTSRKLVLIDEPHNPCRIMMLPMALEGLMSSSKESNSNVAIFHALCASAASNLYELGDRKGEHDRVLALHHEQQAISHLRNNLAQADKHQDQAFAMAIMACITADAISGTTQRWRTHVTGGLAYLAKLHARGLDEAVVAAFQKHMVSMAILCEIPVPNDLKSFLNDEIAAEGLEFTFPYYGVSRSFLRAYDRMTSLGAEVSNPTLELEKDLDAFQLQQYLEFPTLPPQESLSPNQPQGLVLHHTAKVFYYARLVFFQRSIRRDRLDTVQSLVELGIQELESIERVGKGELGNMMLWPVVVLGAECGLPAMQNQMRLWFKNQRKLGFRNVVVLEEMIESIWTARKSSARSGRDIDWRDMIVQPHFDVFRL